eukprot:TRINITY_DN10073_c2_g1_i1.p4 TRINITY_DN10073_c2_g1~~TRINITY_DN10073_c2_g1_i1.p4  ORF type:complete len:134 (-),score=27.27 TRINITY_DN10073_c2_g1_i1:46-447(-)
MGANSSTMLRYNGSEQVQNCKQRNNKLKKKVNKKVLGVDEARALFRSQSVNTQDEAGNTGLHSAVICQDLEKAELALALGADVNIQNNSGCTALHIAVKNEQMQMIELLVEGQVDEGEAQCVLPPYRKSRGGV